MKFQRHARSLEIKSMKFQKLTVSHQLDQWHLISTEDYINLDVITAQSTARCHRIGAARRRHSWSLSMLATPLSILLSRS
mmetsp:Transcript_4691/g.7150  ORF Transcript_4691/g.7150 Transcript_4691/m.7150 type:complete len:80 (-) Transcript_4691:1573-1812(-)